MRATEWSTVPELDPVMLVVHRRLDPADTERYAAWQDQVGAVLADRAGFLDREVLPPKPPHQVDWTVIERFRDGDAARAWIRSPERAALVAQIAPVLIGNDEIHLVTQEHRHARQAASALIASRVEPDDEHAFLAWQREISAAEATFEGFIGHKIERPIPGVQQDWVVVLSFDTEPHLEAWLQSPERTRLLARGERFNRQLSVTRARYGFGFWSEATANEPVFRNNLLVLMTLYPLVFLWSFFVSEPLIDSHGVPFWLSLFIGNLVSTQLLGWFLVPWVFRRFSWFRAPRSRRDSVRGFLAVAAVYAASMALYSWLLSWG
jgi:antibiotic biosynthesis monooxygenase (ABM) superfamily enzyme